MQANDLSQRVEISMRADRKTHPHTWTGQDRTEQDKTYLCKTISFPDKIVSLLSGDTCLLPCVNVDTHADQAGSLLGNVQVVSCDHLTGTGRGGEEEGEVKVKKFR